MATIITGYVLVVDFSTMTTPPSNGTVAGYQSTINTWKTNQGAQEMSYDNSYNTSTKVLTITAESTNAPTWTALEQFTDGYLPIVDEVMSVVGTGPAHDFDFYTGSEDGGSD